MTRSTTESILLYGGGFIILYTILKSWGVIQSQSLSEWNPLSSQELVEMTSKIES